ncbi:hypothetical protein P7C70_g2275, partial [Phenoliferia sp. Uapishka_3]
MPSLPSIFPPSFPPSPTLPATIPPRPSVPTTQNSDSSIDTISSVSASSSSSWSSSSATGESPYSRLVVVSQTGAQDDLGRASGLNSFGGGVGMPPPESPFMSFERRTSSSAPGTRTGSFASQEDGALRRVREGIVEGAAFSASPDLMATRAPEDYAFPSPLEGTPLTSSSSVPVSTPRPAFSTPQPFASSSLPNTSSSASMTRSRSFTPSPTSNSNPSPRPSSSGTFSSNSTRGSFASTSSNPPSNHRASTGTMSGSTRPWVRDSDATSQCSKGSSGRGSWWSSATGEGEDDGEVFRVNGADGIEFLDPRPEPPGATMTINRDDPAQVVLKVTLPGFSLDNITVAMRRGHRVHIVADDFSEQGGHFEKLISLGSDVVSAAPRAEFNGTVLKVYVQRRAPRSGAPPLSPLAPSVPSLNPSPSLPPPGQEVGRTRSRSPLLWVQRGHVVANEDFVPTEDAPIVTRSTGPPPDREARQLAGPEAAKAAAKAAREAANQKAKEAAKSLPKVGKRIPFATALKNALGRGSAAGGEGSPSPPTTTSTSSANSDTEKSPPKLTLRVPGASDVGRRSPSPTPSASSVGSSSNGGDPGPVPNSPSRPRMRESNLTLRPLSGGFLEAAIGQEQQAEANKEPGSTTPKSEAQMRFTPWAK